MSENLDSIWRGGAPAWPSQPTEHDEQEGYVPGPAYRGLTIREHFALTILNGYLAGSGLNVLQWRSHPMSRAILQGAVSLADELLRTLAGQSAMGELPVAGEDAGPPFDPDVLTGCAGSNDKKGGQQ